MRRLKAMPAAMVLAALLFVPIPALATPGDNSNGGWMPSRSPPAFDDKAEIRQGAADLRADRYVEAERRFDHVLQDIPKNEDATFLRGLARARRGDLEGARQAFVRTLLLNPNNLYAHYELGMIYVRLGQIGRAGEQIQALERLARICGKTCADGPYISRAIVSLGEAYDAGGAR